MAPKKSKGDAQSLNTKLALVMKSGKGTCPPDAESPYLRSLLTPFI